MVGPAITREGKAMNLSELETLGEQIAPALIGRLIGKVVPGVDVTAIATAIGGLITHGAALEQALLSKAKTADAPVASVQGL